MKIIGVGAVVAGVVLLLAGCGGSGSEPPSQSMASSLCGACAAALPDTAERPSSVMA